MLQALVFRPQILGLVVLCALGLRLLVPLLLVHHVLDLRLRVLRLLVLQPRMHQAMELWPQVLGRVVLHVWGLRLRMLPLLGVGRFGGGCLRCSGWWCSVFWGFGCWCPCC